MAVLPSLASPQGWLPSTAAHHQAMAHQDWKQPYVSDARDQVLKQCDPRFGAALQIVGERARVHPNPHWCRRGGQLGVSRPGTPLPVPYEDRKPVRIPKWTSWMPWASANVAYGEAAAILDARMPSDVVQCFRVPRPGPHNALRPWAWGMVVELAPTKGGEGGREHIEDANRTSRLSWYLHLDTKSGHRYPIDLAAVAPTIPRFIALGGGSHRRVLVYDLAHDAIGDRDFAADASVSVALPSAPQALALRWEKDPPPPEDSDAHAEDHDSTLALYARDGKGRICRAPVYRLSCRVPDGYDPDPDFVPTLR